MTLNFEIGSWSNVLVFTVPVNSWLWWQLDFVIQWLIKRPSSKEKFLKKVKNATQYVWFVSDPIKKLNRRLPIVAFIRISQNLRYPGRVVFISTLNKTASSGFRRNVPLGISSGPINNSCRLIIHRIDLGSLFCRVKHGRRFQSQTSRYQSPLNRIVPAALPLLEQYSNDRSILPTAPFRWRFFRHSWAEEEKFQ